MASSTESKPFDGIVGQEMAKRKLNFFLDDYKLNRVIPNTIIVGPKGGGKTSLSRALGSGLILFDEAGKPVKKENGKSKKKTFLEINCSTLKSVKQFINGILIPHVQDKDVTVFFDEASEIGNNVTMALLSILNVNAENRNTFMFEDYVCDIDFRRQSFILATSEVQDVFEPLLDRLERIDLEEYTLEEMGAIVQKYLKGVTFKEGALEEIVSTLRGNARAAYKMSQHINTYLGKKGGVFGKKDWVSLKHSLSIFPLGLNQTEINLLRYLKQSTGGISLTRLSAKTGMSKESLQRDIELYLQKQDLLTIGTGGREITTKGIEYIKSLDSGLAPATA